MAELNYHILFAALECHLRKLYNSMEAYQKGGNSAGADETRGHIAKVQEQADLVSLLRVSNNKRAIVSRAAQKHPDGVTRAAVYRISHLSAGELDSTIDAMLADGTLTAEFDELSGEDRLRHSFRAKGPA